MRVISLFPAATEMVCALGAWETLVGVSHDSDYPPEMLHPGIPRVTRSIIDSSAPPAEVDRLVRVADTLGDSLHVLDAESGCAEIGYGLHPDAWGRGLATRMAVAAVGYGFDVLQLHRVEATSDARNLASLAVLRKVGMRHEGRLRENLRLRDGWRDTEVFGVLRHEWVPPEDLVTLT